MPYVPRPATTAQCAHCNATFEKRHASRKYCSNSCNVQASYARTGYRNEGRPTRAELEQAVAKMTQLVEQLTGRPAPAAKAAATKAEAKERLHQAAALAIAAERTIELARTKAQKKKPAAKAAVKPAPGPSDFDFI